MNKKLIDIYHLLLKHYGPQNWWPADSPEEVAIGAILTQNTSWKNVEKAIKNLKKHNLISFEAIKEAPLKLLQELIKPSGFYKQKAIRLKSFVERILNTYKSLNILAEEDIKTIRNFLLKINGIGKETADSIMLYALSKPIFVIDAYTTRLLERLGISISEPKTKRYDILQKLFHDLLPQDVNLYKEFHALIVTHSKEICKKSPLCLKQNLRCPLSNLCLLQKNRG